MWVIHTEEATLTAMAPLRGLLSRIVGCAMRRRRSHSHSDGTTASAALALCKRDLYSALLAAYLETETSPPSIDQPSWEGAEMRLSAAVEELKQRARAGGQKLPRCVGIPGDRARLHENLANAHLELVYRRGRLEVVG